MGLVLGYPGIGATRTISPAETSCKDGKPTAHNARHSKWHDSPRVRNIIAKYGNAPIAVLRGDSLAAKTSFLHGTKRGYMSSQVSIATRCAFCCGTNTFGNSCGLGWGRR